MYDYLVPVLTLSGVIVGGLIGYISNSKIKTKELRHIEIREEVNQKRKLYGDFLAETNRLILKAAKEKSSDPNILATIASIFAQIEMISNENVIETGKQIFLYVMSKHSISENDRGNIKLLREKFVTEARTEINNIQSRR
jgi:hypothetical protein